MTNLSQQTFDRAEEIAEALWMARNLQAALLHLIDAATEGCGVIWIAR